MAAEPDFFVQVLTFVFRAEGEPASEQSPEEQARTRQAYRLLRKWTQVPGSETSRPPLGTDNEAAVIDEESLQAWCRKARALARECGRLGVCDSEIGRIFAYAPADPDGLWPFGAVRELVEELSSDRLDQGLRIGVYNRRGAFFRARGGDQERELVEKYRQYFDKVVARWPRTGAVLDAIRDTYAREAGRYDDTAEYEEYE